MAGKDDILNGIKPIPGDFPKKIKEDKVFLLSLLDDPVKAFRLYGYNGDEKMMDMMQGMAQNIRQRAIRVFSEVANLAEAGQACDACNGCRACKACMTGPIGGGMPM